MKQRRPCPDMREFREEVNEYVLARIVVTPSGCWEWQGDKNALGYAQGHFKGRGWTITRLVYCATRGGFDPNYDMCHTCDNTSCVSPIHVWLGSMSQNIQDAVKKGRHYLAAATHCKRRHPLEGENLYISPASPRRPEKRSCLICQRAAGRIRAGWPEDLAYSLPPQKLGYKPVGLGGKWTEKIRIGRKENCKSGHPLSGENLYIAPDGRRQCRRCKYYVQLRLAAKRESSHSNGDDKHASR
jgi:hypothetical protein